MLFTIPRGKHRARPLAFNFWFRKNIFTWNVSFHDSCKYLIPGEDQEDTNKLCGIGFLPGHHKDSARFGWRYRTDKDMIELSAYCYVKGERFIKPLGLLQVDETYKIQLTYRLGIYYFACWAATPEGYTFGKPDASTMIMAQHAKKFKYRLGTYFGGDKPAPHTMIIGLLKK